MREPIPDLPPVIPCIWKGIPIQPSSEPLVDVGSKGVLTNSVYAGESTDSPYREDEIAGSTLTVFARETVADKLAHAQSLLPDNMGVVVMDAWRSIPVQQSLFDTYYLALRSLHPDWAEAELLAYTQDYVSLPSTNLARPSPHNTGGAVGLLLYALPTELSRKTLPKAEILRIASPVDVGVNFDHGGPESAVRYFEENDGPNSWYYRDNRRLLYWLMQQSGLAAFPPEIWHYNYGNQMAAQAEGHDNAVYGAIELDNSNIAAEDLRRKYYKRLVSTLPMAVKIMPT